jgi:nitrogen fixation/metabolism regulation signal transduction histidine kinase
MNDTLRIVRLMVFVAIAPVVFVVMLFIFIMPSHVDLWFSSERRQEAVDAWRKLWAWAQTGRPIIGSPDHPIT